MNPTICNYLRLPLCLIILSSFVGAATAADFTVQQWVARYDGNQSTRVDEARGVAFDSAGNVIVTGSSDGNSTSTDFYTAKYSGTTGALVWGRRYNGDGNFRDLANAVAVDAAGNVIVTGSTYSGGTGLADMYTVKYAAATGFPLWERFYNGTGNGHDEGKAVAVDSAGNIVVTGYSTGLAGYPDVYTIKYDADGTQLWAKRFNGFASRSDEANALALDSEGNVIVAGYTANADNTMDYLTVKYSAANGAMFWSKQYDKAGKEDYVVAASVDGVGNVVVTGFSYGDYYTAKYAAADGALLWERRYNGPEGYDRPTALAVDSAGNAIVTGESSRQYAGYDFYTAKYAAADGAILWQRRYEGYFYDYERGLVLDNAGNAIVVGATNRGVIGGIGAASYMAKYASSDGAIIWEQQINETTTGIGAPKQIAIAPSGEFAIIGGDADYVTVKYGTSRDSDGDGLPDAWELGRFGNTANGALDDPDHDGRVNLLEMAFGTDPLIPNAASAPSVVIESGYLTTTITKQPGVTYEVESAARPDAVFSSASTSIITNDATTLKVRDNVPIGAAPARFLRAKVTTVP